MCRLVASLGGAITFFVQPMTGSTIALNSEFALNRPELQEVIDALGNAGFTVPALHDHFVDDQERLYFVHGFAVGMRTRWATRSCTHCLRSTRRCTKKINAGASSPRH